MVMMKAGLAAIVGLVAGSVQAGLPAEVTVTGPTPVIVAYTRIEGGRTRLFALRQEGEGWTALHLGAPLDRADLGPVASPRALSFPDGRILVAYLQEDETGIQRAFAVEWTGEAWEPVCCGSPLDAHPEGVSALSLEPGAAGEALLTCRSEDQMDGVLPSVVEAVAIGQRTIAPFVSCDLKIPAVASLPNDR